MGRSWIRRSASAGLLAALVLAWSPALAPPARGAALGTAERSGCVTCHSTAGIRRALQDGRGIALYVPADALARSVHRSLSCGSCHATLTSRVLADMAGQRDAARAACATCHRKEAADYSRGVHVGAAPGGNRVAVLARTAPSPIGAGPGGPAASLGAGCVLCHGSHDVARITPALLGAPRPRSWPGVPIGALFAGLGAVGAVAASILLARRRREPARPLRVDATSGRNAPARPVERAGDGPRDPVRRRILRFIGLAAGAALAGPLVRPSAAEAAPAGRTLALALEHGNDRGLLIDVTRCRGCGACVAACKLANDLPFRADQPWQGPKASLASANWTAVQAVDVAGPGGGGRNLKRQCVHCLEPACVSACPVKAMQKDPLGPVVYDASRCIGCRYCLMACPFGVPTFDWDRSVPKVEKCTLCIGRVRRGQPTACAAACPFGAIQFGKRGELLAEARRRIASHAGYQRHVYGETEAGGTSVLYLSDVPFAALGLPDGVSGTPLPEYSWSVSRLVPPAAAGLGALLLGLYSERRRALLEESEQGSARAAGQGARAPDMEGGGE